MIEYRRVLAHLRARDPIPVTAAIYQIWKVRLVPTSPLMRRRATGTTVKLHRRNEGAQSTALVVRWRARFTSPSNC